MFPRKDILLFIYVDMVIHSENFLILLFEIPFHKHEFLGSKQMILNIINIRTFYHSVFTVVKKNCEPFVLGPAFAMDRTPVNNGN